MHIAHELHFYSMEGSHLHVARQLRQTELGHSSATNLAPRIETVPLRLASAASSATPNAVLPKVLLSSKLS